MGNREVSIAFTVAREPIEASETVGRDDARDESRTDVGGVHCRVGSELVSSPVASKSICEKL
jgi:hypothetical protein